MKTYRITFSHGDTITTGFNGTLEEAKKYYLGNWFQFGDTEECPKDSMAKGISVEEVQS
jgi:hypothetical protein